MHEINGELSMAGIFSYRQGSAAASGRQRARAAAGIKA